MGIAQRYVFLLFIVLSAAVIAAPAACGDSIQLRRAIRMPENRTQIYLKDIAVLEGESATALGEIMILDNSDPASMQTIRLDDLRTTLERAGAHWGTVHLSGGDVLVRPRAGAADATVRAMEGVSIGRAPAAAPIPREHRENTLAAVGVIYERTLRAAIAQRIVHGLQIDPIDLRIIFDIKDDETLGALLDDNRFELQPISSFESERIEFMVRRWVDGRVAESGTISVQPLVRQSILTALRDLRRGDSPVDGDVSEREQWVSPIAARLHASRDSVVGKVAARNIRQGEALRTRDFQGVAVIKRGDQVTVRCVSGGLVITLAAEARADGAAGEEIPFRKLGERDTFLAVVSGPGEAVIQLNRP